ncbi:tetratricopeptide repeat protein [Bacteroidota bacterium]
MSKFVHILTGILFFSFYSFENFSLKAVKIDTFLLSYYVNIDKGEYEEALMNINESFRKHGASHLLFELKGDCYFFQQKFQDALDSYLKSDSLKPDYGSYKIARIYALLEDYGTAINYLRKHLESRYKLPESNILLDESFSELSKTKDWSELWKEEWYSVRDKSISEIQFLLKYKNSEEALDILNEKIGSNPMSHEYYYLRATAYFVMKEYKLVIEDLNQAIKLTKTNPDYYRMRANAFSNMNNYNKAVDDYFEVLELNPYELKIFKNIAFCYARKGDFKNAAIFIENYLNFYDKDEEALFECGNIYFQNKKFLHSLRYYNRAISLNSAKADYYIARANAYINTKTYKFAESDLSMALDLEPRNSETYYMRALSRFYQGNKNGACNDWQKAMNMGNSKAMVEHKEKCNK